MLSVYRNTSTIGNISYGNRTTFGNIYNPISLAVNDMDGDALPDIIVNSGSGVTNVFENNSSVAGLSFQQSPNYSSDGYTYDKVFAFDVDNDGKPDILNSTSSFGQSYRTILSKSYVQTPLITSVVPITASAGTFITIKGDRFTGANAVSFGGVAAASFVVLSDSVITAIVGNGASGNVTIAIGINEGKYPGFTFSPPIPTIDSFAPKAGPVGSTVIIKGKNFGSTPADNKVYFGSGIATVTAATDTMLTVTVPAYTSYLPISVYVKSAQLTAFSQLPFNTTFEANVTNFSNANFGDTVNYASNSYSVGIATADFNADIKPDIVAAIYYNYTGYLVYQNSSTLNRINFNRRYDYGINSPGGGGGNASGVTRSVAPDIDGDGNADIATIYNYSNAIGLVRNTSTADSISFSSQVIFATGSNPTKVTAADLDNDGKPDFVVTNSSPGTISIFKNISKPGNIALTPRVDLVAGVPPSNILLEDFDNDGKRDMATVIYNSTSMMLWRNTSTPGAISFDNKTLKTTAATPAIAASADLDGDGKIDILVLNGTPKTISVFKNTSTLGTISFADKVDYVLFGSGDITITDLDGDGKPDVLVGNSTNSTTNTISIFKNNSTLGNIVFAARVEISKTYPVNTLFTTDVNGDGKPDIILSSPDRDKISILRNSVGDPLNTALCKANDSTLLQSDITGTTYQWQVDTGTGFVNITDNINYVGSSTRNLKLKNLPTSWYGYIYKCVVDVRNSTPFKLVFTKTWLGNVSTAWENPLNWNCGTLPDEYTDVIIPANKTVVVNSNVAIRSLKASYRANIKVNDGFTITVVK